MAIHLVVTIPFADYQKGDKITDAKVVADVLDSPQAPHVVKVAAPDIPVATKPAA